jgi:ABC-2 type transport system permease protein
LLPVAVLVAAVLCSGLALLLATVNVWARDTQHLLDLVLLAMFWANPIVYDYFRAASWFGSHHLPSWLPLTNPFTSIIITFQRAIYGAATTPANDGTLRRLLPDVGSGWYLRNLAIVGLASTAILAFALWLFDRAEGNFAEVL